MPPVMEPSWVGQRVSVRRVVERTDDGGVRVGDVVGDLVGLDAQTAVVETRSGLVEVPVPLVVAARKAPPSTADELALDGVAARGLRAHDTEQLGGWLLRADHGFLRRANSVLPLRQLGMPLDEAITRARAWYAQRGLPLLLTVPTEARRLLDAELGERGWEPLLDSHVMTARLDRLDTAPADGVELLTADHPDEAWLAVYRGGDEVDARAAALLARHDRVTFVSLRQEGRTVAIGRGVVDDGWLGVAAVEVVPDARRQGLARLVTAALARWGDRQGAARSYLQVEAANDAAIALYSGLGYRVHHDYRYRLDPGAERDTPIGLADAMPR